MTVRLVHPCLFSAYIEIHILINIFDNFLKKRKLGSDLFAPCHRSKYSRQIRTLRPKCLPKHLTDPGEHTS